MINKNQIKHIIGLQLKKNRLLHQQFICEGEKNIAEFLNSDFELVSIFSNDFLFDTKYQSKTLIISTEDMKKISSLTTPSTALAVFKIPTVIENNFDTQSLILALDNVRDPGNLGTIIRLCDWFGITTLYCSSETVDCYNPKVVQATMGSLTRVSVQYVALESVMSKTNLPIFGTFMNGKNIYDLNLPEKGIIVMGNEANGISANVEKLITNKISIPRFGTIQKTESLNVATATAIILSEFRR